MLYFLPNNNKKPCFLTIQDKKVQQMAVKILPLHYTLIIIQNNSDVFILVPSMESVHNCKNKPTIKRKSV